MVNSNENLILTKHFSGKIQTLGGFPPKSSLDKSLLQRSALGFAQRIGSAKV